jgi:hypothetical protein
MSAVIRKRLEDYSRRDPSVERQKLIDLWRKHHPEACKETSSALKPLMMISQRVAGDHPSEPDEYWANDTYHVTLRRKKVDPVFGSKGGMIHLGIHSHDGTARHDWRDFQAIKNQLAGKECEAFELYPADSRLLDPSNYYSLWCFPGVNKIKVGQGPEKREVLDADQALAPQRALAPESE